MHTRVRAPSSEAIAEAVTLLHKGALIGLPTETVYGLAADAADPVAVGRIFAAKGRPADHPVIVHVAPGADLSRWAAEVPDAAHRLIEAFWPGPLTLILRRAAGVPDAVTGGQETVGVRCPSHPVAVAVLRAFGGGVAAPSANRFGRVSPTTAQHVAQEFGPEVSLILDGGSCEVGIESTIVDVSGDEPVLLRPGRIGPEALAAVLGAPVRGREAAGGHVPRVSGALAAHYAPHTPLRVVPSAQLAETVVRAQAAHARLAVWSRQPAPAGCIWLQAPEDPERYAHDLYATLRALDARGAEWMIVEAPPEGAAWDAVRDRLGRAAAGSGPAEPALATPAGSR